MDILNVQKTYNIMEIIIFFIFFLIIFRTLEKVIF